MVLLGCGMGAGWYLAQGESYKAVIQDEMTATQRIQVSEKPGAEVLKDPEASTPQVEHPREATTSGTNNAAPPAHLPAAVHQRSEHTRAHTSEGKAESIPANTASEEMRPASQKQETKPALLGRTQAAPTRATTAQTSAPTSAPRDNTGKVSFNHGTDPIGKRARVLQQAQQHYNRADYPAAIGILQQQLEQDTRGSDATTAQIIALDARIYRQLALAHLRLNQPDAAINTLEHGHIHAPEDLELHILYARVLMEQDRNTRAYTMLRNLEQPQLPAHPDFYALRAALARQQGAYAEAIELYALLCKFQPQRGDWRLGLAISQHQHGDLEQARQNYQRAAANARLDSHLRDFAARQAEQLQTSNPGSS
jgi:predicted Zn-dependent protease